MQDLVQPSTECNHENKKHKGISAPVAERGAPRDVPKRSGFLGRSVTSIHLGVPCSEYGHASTETGRLHAVVSSEGMIAWLPSGNTSRLSRARVFNESYHNHLLGLDAPARHSQKRHVAEPCELNHRSARTYITLLASPSWRPVS